MGISLKNHILRFLLLPILIIMAVWAVLFYFFMLEEVYDNIDEGLENQKEEILDQVEENPELLKMSDFALNQYRITSVPKGDYPDDDQLNNEILQISSDSDGESYRVLRTYFEDEQGNDHLLEIAASTVQEDDLLFTMAMALAALYVVLMLSIYIINFIELNRAFKPFRKIIEQLKRYRFGDQNQLDFPDSKIKEFNQLSAGIQTMVNDNRETFVQQKHFIENASHELKTPVAIIQNKIDWMIENEEMTENQIHQLSDIKKAGKRMAELVKSLLVLSKIENQQFQEISDVNFNEIINEITDDSSDWLEFKNITLNIKETSAFKVKMNRNLAHILISNLFQNALKYTENGGNIRIETDAKAFTISNTAKNGALDTNRIFNRFYKQSDEQLSAGLGLAIVKGIVNQYPPMRIDYYFQENKHFFKLSQ